MKILHLLSNWKWTERSEPAADLALAQQKAGAEVCFVCGATKYNEPLNGVMHNLERKGLTNAVAFKMPKHLNPLSLMSDAKELKKLRRHFRWDLIHAHMPNAHLTAAYINKGHRKTKIVRQYYNPDHLRTDTRSRKLLEQHTDGAIVVSRKMYGLMVQEGSLPPDRICVAPPGIDLERFRPGRILNVPEELDFGLTRDNFVIGIITRIRAARRLDIVLKALAEISEQYPHVRLLLVGRGSDGALENIVLKPAAKMGLSDKIVVAGYCRNDELVRAIRAMNVLAYPTAGTDKTCRTVRETMAAGVTVVAPELALLPDIIVNRHTGMFMHKDGADLAQILAQLIREPELAGNMGHNAYDYAVKNFALETQARITLDFYEHVLQKR